MRVRAPKPITLSGSYELPDHVPLIYVAQVLSALGLQISNGPELRRQLVLPPIEREVIYERPQT